MKNDLSQVLIRPHITEKATIMAESSVYVFQVDPRFTKNNIEKAFVEKYKINPVKVTTVTIPAKSVIVRGKRGKKSGYKRAYICLAKGQKLESL